MTVLDRLRRLVELESPSDDEAGLRAVADELADQLREIGARIEARDVPGVGRHVLARLAGAGAPDGDARPILVLGHLDTVHPVGSFDPAFEAEAGRARGPGVFDMKGGWACVLEALSRRADGSTERHRPITLLATCDEETGSEHSRELIVETARGARAVLVPEPPLDDGSCKTRRKGVGWYRLEVEGRSSHAGLDPASGVNAVVELGHQVRALVELAHPAAGTTVTPTAVAGGTAPNVVPRFARVDVDVRFATAAEGNRVDGAIRGLRPVLEGARLRVEGGINRPPMERTEASGALYERARALAAEAGWELGEGGSGGASDGSLTAAAGVPTLDGLGPRGGGAHAQSEHIEVADLDRRVRLYRRLLETL